MKNTINVFSNRAGIFSDYWYLETDERINLEMYFIPETRMIEFKTVLCYYSPIKRYEYELKETLVMNRISCANLDKTGTKDENCRIVGNLIDYIKKASFKKAEEFLANKR